MLFWNLKRKESEKIDKRDFDILKSEIGDIKLQMRLLDSDIANLRGRFNRQLGGLKANPSEQVKEEEKVAPKEEEKPKHLNTPEPKVFTGMYGIDFPK